MWTRLLGAGLLVCLSVCHAYAQTPLVLPESKFISDVFLLAREITAASEPDDGGPIPEESVRIVSDWLFAKRTEKDLLARIGKGEAFRLFDKGALDDYCAKLDSGLRQQGATTIQLRFDVAQARLLIEALLPDLADLASNVQKAEQTPFGIASEFRKLLQRRVQDDRAAHLLRLAAARPGAIEYLKKVGALREDAAALERIADRLGLEPKEPLRWCDRKPATVPPLREARETAERWVSAVRAITDPAFVEKLRIALENMVGLPATLVATGVVESGLPTLRKSDANSRCADGQAICWSTHLEFEVPNSRQLQSGDAQYARAHVRLRQHSPNQQAALLFPTGVTIENIEITRDLATNEIKYSVARHPYLPTQPRVNLEALREGLRAANFPFANFIVDASVSFTHDLSELKLDATVDLPVLGVKWVVKIPLLGADQHVGAVVTDAMKKELDAAAASILALAKKQASELRLALPIAGIAEPQKVEAIVLDEVGDAKLALSTAVNIPGVGRASVWFDLNTSLPPKLTVRRTALPLELVRALEAKLRSSAARVLPGAEQCIGLAGLTLIDGTDGVAALVVDVPKGATSVPLKVTSLDSAQLVNAVAQTAGLSLENCLADKIRAEAAARIQALISGVLDKKLSLLGVEVSVAAARAKSVKGGSLIVVDLKVTSCRENVMLNGAILKATWNGDGPLVAGSIDLSSTTLSAPGDGKTLLECVLPGLHQIAETVRIERLHWLDAGPVISLSINLKGFTEPVRIHELLLDARATQAAAREALNAATGAYLRQHANDVFREALKDVGAIRAVTVSVAELFPKTGGPRLSLAAEVELSAKIVVPMTIDLLPSIQVHVDSGDAIQKSLIGALSGYLGGLLGPGAPVKKVRAIADTKEKKYGLRFDVDLQVIGPKFAAVLEGVEITNRGFRLPEAITVKVDITPPPIPIPPVFAFSNPRVTIFTRTAGTFAVGGDIVLQADPQGVVVVLRGEVRGSVKEKTLRLDAKLLVVGIPFATAQGQIDFGNGTLDASAQTVDPLAKLLTLKSKLHVDGPAQSADMSSEVKLFGLNLTQFELTLRHLGSPKNVRAQGKASAKLPGVATADLTVDAAADLSRSTAEGSLEFISGSLFSGNIRLTPAIVEARLKALGIRVRVVVRSASLLTPKLLDDILKRLLDFHPSFDFKRPEINIVLVDGNGKQVDREVGGGPPAAPLEGQQEQPRDSAAPPSQSGGVNRLGGQGDGTILARTDRLPKKMDICRDNEDGEWELVQGLNASAMEFDQREVKRNISHVVYFNRTARIVSDQGLELLREVERGTAKVLACFNIAPRYSNAWEFKKHRLDIASSRVAVIARNSTETIEALLFQFGKAPVALDFALSQAEGSVFGGSLKTAKTADWKLSELGLPILAFLTAQAIDAKSPAPIKIDTILSLEIAHLPPEWRQRKIAALRDVGGGRPRLIAISNKPFFATRGTAEPNPLNEFLKGGWTSDRRFSGGEAGYAALVGDDHPAAKLASQPTSLVDRILLVAELNRFEPQLRPRQPDRVGSCSLIQAQVGNVIQFVAVSDGLIGYVSAEQSGPKGATWFDSKEFVAELCPIILSSRGGYLAFATDRVDHREWVAVDKAGGPQNTIHLLQYSQANQGVGVPRQQTVEAIRKCLQDWSGRQVVKRADWHKLETAGHRREMLAMMVTPNGNAPDFFPNSRGLFDCQPP